MAALHRNFDATQVAPRDNSPVPKGDYLAVIVSTEWKNTKAGNGRYLEVEEEIVDGPHKGRHVWDRLNLDNPTPKAVEIAEQTLSAICHAVGRHQVNDSQQLHNIPHVISTDIERGDNGRDNTVIKSYKQVQRAAGAQQQPAAQASAAPAAQQQQQQQQPIQAAQQAQQPVQAKQETQAVQTTPARGSKPAWAR